MSGVERVELWHRCDPSPPARDALADLTTHVERTVAGTGVELVRREWPGRLDAPGADPGPAGRAYARFRRWADSEGVDLDPAFERATWRNEFVDEVGEEILLPVACLAWYDGVGEVRAVYPHVDDEVRDVPTGIEELERVIEGDAGREPPTVSRAESGAGAATVD